MKEKHRSLLKKVPKFTQRRDLWRAQAASLLVSAARRNEPPFVCFYKHAENVREEKSGCEWHFVTAKSRTDLEPILAGYDQAVDKRTNASDPQGPLYHILRVFLIDREGRIRNIYSFGTLDPRLILADVKTLLLEEARISKQ